MAETRQLTEQECLVIGSVLAQESLALPLLLNRKGRILYFITDALYSKCALQGDVLHTSSSVVNNSEIGGWKIPGGLDEFIESALKEADCAGIVPLTKEAQKALVALGLKPVLFGQTILPERLSFDAYK